MAIRVATLNIWGRDGDWRRRRDVLRDGFRALDADLIALQETILDGGYDQVADVLGAGYHVVHHSRRGPGGVGCSIASRWEPEDVQETVLDGTARVEQPDFLGQSAAIDVASPAGRLLFVNHKPSWQLGYEHERELQAVSAARFIEDVVGERDMHVVVAGDMDARPESASMRFWTGRQSLGGMSVAYLDAWEFARPGEDGLTFTLENPQILAESGWARIPGRRIDYVLVRCGDRGPALRIASCSRLFDRPVGEVWGSDHFGVVADLAAAD